VKQGVGIGGYPSNDKAKRIGVPRKSKADRDLRDVRLRSNDNAIGVAV
jgi:hypothetical protein